MSNKNYYQKRKAAVLQEAIEWQQNYFTDDDSDYDDLIEWQIYFDRLGRRYGLLTEFRENCIC